MVITFLSDFGLQDDFVGTCHGVMKRIAPEAEIIDITHGIPPQQVLQGSLVLCNTLPYMPVGVHLAVVDPGVGSHRRPLALRTADGRLLVGPDNGLLLPAADTLGGVAEVHELANPEYALDSVSRTFHGRDLFSPAAAHLSLGVPLAELGPPIDPQALVRLDVPAPEVGQNRIRAVVLYVDHFGNMQLNLKRDHLEQAGVLPGVTVELELALDRYYATAARTFADARAGDIILYEDSYGNIAIAISGGSAAALFGAGRERGGPHSPAHAVNLAELERSSAVGFARVTTNAVVARPGSWRRASAGRRARSSTGSRRAGTRCAGRRHSPRWSARSRRCPPRRSACSTSVPAPGSRPSSPRGASRRPRSSASTSRRGWSSRPAQNTPPELAERVRFEQADAVRLPFEDGSFDLVQLANMIPFFDELARVAAPGGHSSCRSPRPRRRSGCRERLRPSWTLRTSSRGGTALLARGTIV